MLIEPSRMFDHARSLAARVQERSRWKNRFPTKNTTHNVRGQLIRVARREIASLYGLDSITDDDERRHTLEHLLDNNTYMLRAVDHSLPVAVRYLHLSWRGR
jgi:hypothetical protein